MDYLHIKKCISQHFDSRNLRLHRGVLEVLEFMEGMKFTEEDFRKYLVEGTDSDVQPLISFVTAANKAKAENIAPSTDTEAESEERLVWILEKLGLTPFRQDIEKQLKGNEPAVIVDENFKDWYTPERAAENTNYWDDYQRVLSRNGWDAASISAVDEQATEVLRRIEDPKAEHYQSSRGLVVGYVQSGKTANFTALAAKAIDAGYRFIIILAGTMNNLREQTQRRLDKELAGKEAVLDGLDYENLTDEERKLEAYFFEDEEWEREWHEKGGAFLSHGSRYGDEGFPRIRRVTTSFRDYQRAATNVIDIERPFKSKPMHDPANLDNTKCLIAVVKKNATVLKHFNSDLRRAAKANKAFLDLPVMVIDDESDQASINTKDQRKRTAKEERDRTAVNREITEILKNCPRAQYIGYTATPFANVFVDPNDPEDLYPRHFVLMLNEPPAYRGARWFHDRKDFEDGSEEPTIENSQSKAFIRDLLDSSSASDEFFDETRIEELQTALDMFVLTGAIKKYRQSKLPELSFRHHTMLVHEGVGTEIHSDAAAKLRELWRKRAYNSGRPILELKQLFEEDLLPVMQVERYNPGYPVPSSYAELHPFINEAFAEMMAGVDPSRAPLLQVDTHANETPNFESGPVWKILVGGAKLSRGYTVEGLTISYFRRRASSADTLMQTGRWFGFRKGYQDLVRLYAPADLVEMFEAAMHDEEVFRDNIKAFMELDGENTPKLTPMRLAPLVRQSLPFLKPTGSSKMFNAYIKKVAPAPRAVELNTIPEKANKDALVHNFDNVALPMLRRLHSAPVELAYVRVEGARSGKYRISKGVKNFHVGTMPADTFLTLLDGMKWYEGSNYKANVVQPHIEYMKGLIGRGRHSNPRESDFREVAIILPRKSARSKNAVTIKVPGIPFEVPLVDRNRREGRTDITGTDRKDTYVLESIAAGLPVSIPRIEELRQYAEDLDFELDDFQLGEEPFDLDPDFARNRGGVLLTLFDDRGRDYINEARKNKTYTPPQWEKGEVGVALALVSPHAALQGQFEVIEWGVHLPSADGKDKPIVDMSEQGELDLK